jgi:hypothetical protein
MGINVISFVRAQKYFNNVNPLHDNTSPPHTPIPCNANPKHTRYAHTRTLSSISTAETFLGFEVLTPVVMKSIIFWDITPCSPLIFNRCFGGTYLLHLQGQRIRRVLTWNQVQIRGFHVLCRWFVIILPWWWRRYVPPKCRLTFNKLHTVMSPNTEIFEYKSHSHLATKSCQLG